MIRDAVRIFLLSFLIIYNFINISFAKEYFYDQTYTITYDEENGVKFETKPNKTALIYRKTEENQGKSDYTWDWHNGYCVASIPAFGISGSANYSKAQNNYYDSNYQDNIYKLCGSGWLTWGNHEVKRAIEQNGGCGNNNCSEYQNIKEYYPELDAFYGSKKHAVLQCVYNVNNCEEAIKFEMCTKGENDHTCVPIDGGKTFNINDEIYRENLYDGEEIVNPNCPDPRPEALEYDIFRNRTDGKVYQTYYMRGYEAGNYACDRFLLHRKKVGDEFDEAYKCCKKAEKSVCIYRYERSALSTFCSIDSTAPCKIGELEFIIYKGTDENGRDLPKYCAKTYNLCPYNFTIESGMEISDVFTRVIDATSQEDCEKKDDIENCNIKYSQDDCTEGNKIYENCLGNIKNFYQYNRHCVLVQTEDTSAMILNENYAPFLDKSCLNSVGSSHNIDVDSTKVYNGYERLKTKYIFSANVVECFTETLKNFLFNRAGHTRCIDTSEIPGDDETCESGEIYVKGKVISDFSTPSDEEKFNYPLKSLIIAIRSIVYTFILFAITLYGYNILLKGGKIGDRREIVMFLIKIVIIISLSVNKFWYDHIFTFAYGVSDMFFNAVAKITFNTDIDINGNFIKDDGCYFGDINLIKNMETSPKALEALEQYPDNYYDQYPSDRRYMAFFDTLDCKMSKYLGLKGDYGSPGIMKILMYSLLNPMSLGIYLGVLSLLTGLMILIFILKISYIFIASMTALTILLFLSPIIIPLILFKRTSKIFSEWLKNVIGFALQPFIMVAYISISIVVIDEYTTGEALFIGRGLDDRELVCGYSCTDINTNELLAYTTNRSASASSKLLEEDYKGALNVLSFDKCTADDIIIDIKRNSALCMMDDVVTVPVLGIWNVIFDVFLSDIFVFLRLACMLFILNMMLNKIPAMSSTLIGSAAVPGLSNNVDLIELVGKLAAFARGVVRILKRASVRIVDGISNLISKSK